MGIFNINEPPKWGYLPQNGKMEDQSKLGQSKSNKNVSNSTGYNLFNELNLDGSGIGDQLKNASDLGFKRIADYMTSGGYDHQIQGWNIDGKEFNPDNYAHIWNYLNSNYGNLDYNSPEMIELANVFSRMLPDDFLTGDVYGDGRNIKPAWGNQFLSKVADFKLDDKISNLPKEVYNEFIANGYTPLKSINRDEEGNLQFVGYKNVNGRNNGMVVYKNGKFEEIPLQKNNLYKYPANNVTQARFGVWKPIKAYGGYNRYDDGGMMPPDQGMGGGSPVDQVLAMYMALELVSKSCETFSLYQLRKIYQIKTKSEKVAFLPLTN